MIGLDGSIESARPFFKILLWARDSDGNIAYFADREEILTPGTERLNLKLGEYSFGDKLPRELENLFHVLFSAMAESSHVHNDGEWIPELWSILETALTAREYSDPKSCPAVEYFISVIKKAGLNLASKIEMGISTLYNYLAVGAYERICIANALPIWDSALEDGLTDEECCNYYGIDQETLRLYRYLFSRENDDFEMAFTAEFTWIYIPATGEEMRGAIIREIED